MADKIIGGTLMSNENNTEEPKADLEHKWRSRKLRVLFFGLVAEMVVLFMSLFPAVAQSGVTTTVASSIAIIVGAYMGGNYGEHYSNTRLAEAISKLQSTTDREGFMNSLQLLGLAMPGRFTASPGGEATDADR